MAHRGAVHRDAGSGLPDRASLMEQIFRIVMWIIPTSDHCRIARLFSQHGEPALQPPCQWVEPIDASIQSREPLDQRIAPMGVFVLVRQHGIQLGPRPLVP